MSPQLTLQTPLQIPPTEIPSYLDQLWSNGEDGNSGANTFSLLIWQPAWIEQELIRTAKINGPIVGNQRNEIVLAAREVLLENELPHSTAPFDESITSCLSKEIGTVNGEDLRGQHIDSAISALNPRRLITLAPTINDKEELQTLVAAYCPLPEEGGGNSACGDVVVLRGGIKALENGLGILEKLPPKELPSWLWWNGNIDEAPELLKELAVPQRRLIFDTALGSPLACLQKLQERIIAGQAVNDLNWLRLRSWRESLAMVFDPPARRASLLKVVNLDIDIQGDNPVQGLLLAAWMADRLKWEIKQCHQQEDGIIQAIFNREGKGTVIFRLVPLPVGNPSIHPGQIVGIRLICEPIDKNKNSCCVILASESQECMRLEAGGMADMELIEKVVPIQKTPIEMDVARLLDSSRGTTSPLLAAAAPLAVNLLSLLHSHK